MAEHRLLGRPAAAGIAIGRVHVRSQHQAIGEPAARLNLRQAITVTLEELRALQSGLDRNAADIVQFQIEMLEDDELTGGAFAAVEAGMDPGTAFRDAVGVHLRGYEETQDEYLGARAADLRDLRDRVLRILSGAGGTQADAPPDGSILIADDLAPTAFLEIDWRQVKGAATLAGSPASHVAMLARARGIPMIVGLEDAGMARGGVECILDADSGMLVMEPGRATLAHYMQKAGSAGLRLREEVKGATQEAVTRGGQRIRVYVNVDGPDSLRGAPRAWFDGIGLVRTELLLDTAAGMPDVETQVEAYRPLFDWSAGGPTTIRLLDAGADKPVPGLAGDGGSNPFLGTRGVRLLLQKPAILRAQLAAIVTAAHGRAVRILIPMVTIPEEVAACRQILGDVITERGTGGGVVALGMMVETPAAALTIERFAADFFSLGTNDLVQYVMAAGRDQRQLDHLLTPTAPAVMELVGRVVRHGREAGKEVSVCGDSAFMPESLQALLRAGVTAVSIPAQRAPAVKSLIRKIDVSES